MTTGLLPASEIPRDARDPSTYFQRRRPLFWCALAWAAGIVHDDLFGLPASQAYTAALMLGGAGLLWRMGARTRGHALLALALAAFAGGVGTHAAIARILPGNHISYMTRTGATPCLLQGVVRQALPTAHGGARWVIGVEGVVISEQSTEPTTGLVQVYVKDAPEDILEGSRVRLKAVLSAPADTFPDDFDLAAYLHRNGIHRVGEVDESHPIEHISRSSDPVLLARRWSHALSARLSGMLPLLVLEERQPGSQAALLNALLFGRREHLDRADRDAFAATGTAHLLAISGLQIQFLAWLFWSVARGSKLRPRTSALLLLALTWGYSALSGAEPPIVRAAVMISVPLLGLMIRRESDPLNMLGAAAILILACDPDQLYQAGFQLSFAAVFGLTVLSPILSQSLRRDADDDPLAQLEAPAPRGLRHHLKGVALVSFAAWLATAPVIAFHMKQFSILCVPVNIVAVPLSSAAMVCGLLTLLFSFSALAAAPFAWAAFALLALLQTLTDLAAAVPYSTLRVAPPPAWLLILLALAVLGVWMRRGSRRLPLLSGGLCLVLCGSIAAHRSPSPPEEPMTTILHVPHGRAVVLQHGGDAVLIDAGGPSSGALVGNWLERQGVRTLKAVVALESRYYSAGGLADVIRRVPTERALLPRDLSPTVTRRALEALLRERKIPWSDDPRSLPDDLLRGFTLKTIDDSAQRFESRAGRSVFAMKISCGPATLLLLPARSEASLARLRKNAPPEFLRAHTLALCGDTWPEKAFTIADIAPARLLNLSENPLLLDIPLVLMHRIHDGSVRLIPENGTWRMEIFENGAWSPRK